MENENDGERASSTFGVRYLWLVCVVQFSLLVAVVAGVVKKATGVSAWDAVLFGGGAFCVVIGLCLTVRQALRQS
ncbi:hypothetical protein SAMN05421837_10552 [Amycolatopsis pretoriensis]|uniref:Uncharacterized protein n=1 Tax=Amycolatopsis pretoriensis TaxID=218821 RepID=A0A1H5QVM4_9PSEU|nr:hypothetical protein SAMN05421837_10552 [Amycolatopsis pretoriensis]